MMVVQTFARGKQRKPDQIGRAVVVGPPAEVMTGAVHGSAQGQVEHEMSDCACSSNGWPEDPDECNNSDAESNNCVVQQCGLDRVWSEIFAVLPDGLGVSGGSAVKGNVGELHPQPTKSCWGVRVEIGVGVGMMPAMHCHPLLRSDTREQPGGNAADPPCHWVQRERSVGEGAVEVHGGDQVGHLGKPKGHDDDGKYGTHRFFDLERDESVTCWCAPRA